MGAQGLLVQIGKFGVVGIFNTAIDFSIFNFLSSRRIGFGKILANFCSTTIAMVFSFFASRQEVFHASHGNAASQAGLFLITTGFGLWVLQTGVFYLMLQEWKWPAKLIQQLLRGTTMKTRVGQDVVLRNAVKVVATLVSLTWNFIMYKFVVFR
jgi:putative flippase GtrA